MMHSRLRAQRGMTLLEILLYVSISGLVIFAASSLLSTIYEVKQKGRIIQLVETEGTLASYTLERYIKNASTVFQPALYKTGETMSLTVVDNNIESNVYVFAEKGVLYVAMNNGEKKALTTTDIVISDLSFKFFGSSEKGFLSYTFTATAADGTGRNSYAKTFSSGASLR
jgi:type II secretory pathway pseudopilin PulG